MAQVIIPTPLRKFTGNQGTVEGQGNNVLEVIQNVTQEHPELQQHLLDENGELRQFVRIYLGDEDINALDKENTQVEQDAVISIIPAIAGGRS